MPSEVSIDVYEVLPRHIETPRYKQPRAQTASERKGIVRQQKGDFKTSGEHNSSH